MDAVHWLLAEYHDVFSLDAAELGCTHSMEHTIKVIDDTPFKEWFRLIPPLLVEETQPECLVQSSGIGAEKEWWFTVLYWLPLPKYLHEKGLLPSA